MSLIGLPINYRFIVYNQLGQNIAPNSINIRLRRSKFDTTGQLVYETAVYSVSNANSIGNAAYGAVGSAGINNVESGWLTGDGLWLVGPTGAASGSIQLYVQPVPDSGGVWGTFSESTLIDIITYANTVLGGKRKGFFI